MKPFIISILVLAGIVGILKWSNNHDKKTLEAYQRYEECVQDEYGTTPSRWYAEHGELPSCQR